MFKGHKAKAELGVTSYVLDAPKGTHRPVTFAFNGGPGSSSVWLHLGLLGPRRVDSGDAGDLDPAALRPARQHRDPARGLRPRLHRPCLDRLLPRGGGRQAQGLPRFQGRHRECGRADPAVDHAPQPLALTEVHRRRVLRHDPRRCPRRAPAGPSRALRQRHHADQLGARPRHGRLRVPQRPRTRRLPADLCRHRPLPRQARPQVTQDRPRRGGGVCRARLPVGPVPRIASHRGRTRRARHPARLPDRAVRGVRRPCRPAGRARPVLHRAAPRPGAGGGPSRRPVHRAARARQRRDVGRGPLTRRDQRTLCRGLEPLRP